MIKVFKIIIFVIVFISILWLLANPEQKQDLKEKLDAVIVWGNKFSPIFIDQNVQKGKIVEHSATLDTKDVVEHSTTLSTKNIKAQINACAKVGSNQIDHRLIVYEWIDHNGHSQFSDNAPKQGYTNLKVKGLYIDNYFNLKLDSRYADLPAFTQTHIQSGVTKIYNTLIQVIKVSELRAINLNLKFFSDKNQFHSYRQKVAPTTGFKATGFYTSRLNEATILAVGSQDHMTSISLHESTHAIVAAMFGGAPVWLNEGLASFFDRMVITGEQTYKFSTDDRRFRLLRNSSLPTLHSHLTQSPQQWYAPINSDLNYAIDWSLIFYMMINSSRRDFLRGMLEHLAVNDCHNFSTISYINRYYSGGVSDLESGWRNWLRNAPSGIVTF